MNSIAGNQAANQIKRHRPSVEIINKMVNNTLGCEIITPRNNKLVPKITLLKKMPSDSHERGQSSNYRRVRMNRVGNRVNSVSDKDLKLTKL